MTQYARHCSVRLKRISRTGAKRGLRKPSIEEIQQAKVSNVADMKKRGYILGFNVFFQARIKICFVTLLKSAFPKPTHVVVGQFNYSRARLVSQELGLSCFPFFLTEKYHTPC